MGQSINIVQSNHPNFTIHHRNTRLFNFVPRFSPNTFFDYLVFFFVYLLTTTRTFLLIWAQCEKQTTSAHFRPHICTSWEQKMLLHLFCCNSVLIVVNFCLVWCFNFISRFHPRDSMHRIYWTGLFTLRAWKRSFMLVEKQLFLGVEKNNRSNASCIFIIFFFSLRKITR